MRGRKLGYQQGFTLMELVLVIVILGIVALASSRMVFFGVDTFVSGASRQHMASTGRFITERLSRELRNAVPGSVEAINGGTCLNFRPIAGAFHYLELPVAPSAASQTAIVMSDDNFAYDTTREDYLVVVNALRPDDFETASEGAAVLLSSNGYTSVGDNAYQLTFADAHQFPDDSPAERLYISYETIRYCLVGGSQIYRYETHLESGDAVTTEGGVLMGQWFANQASEPLFKLNDANYEGALVELTLRLTEHDEEVVLHHEIHLLQSP